MKIVLAPDSYKGSLAAKEACAALSAGVSKAGPDAQIVAVPMADGGEGTVQSLVDATGGQLLKAEVQNPLGVKISAQYGILGDGETAVIEMAEASGLYLIKKEERNPLHTCTYGTGQLIRAALERGCRKFILGIGGSATNDGGTGMARALGVRFLDAQGQELPPGGGSLRDLTRIDFSGLDPRLKECTFTVACDVDNSLCGPRGASFVFGPQKGATPALAAQLDANLEHYAQIIQQDLGIGVKDRPGAGAAGGLGAGMLAFLDAALQPGVEIVIAAVGLRENLAGADLVITGEGQCDFQSVHGKVPFGVAKEAAKLGIPCVVIAGTVGRGVEELYAHGVTSVFSLIDRPLSLEEAMAEAGELLEKAAERIMRLFSASNKNEKV
jgi:glycerate kinase